MADGEVKVKITEIIHSIINVVTEDVPLGCKLVERPSGSCWGNFSCKWNDNKKNIIVGPIFTSHWLNRISILLVLFWVNYILWNGNSKCIQYKSILILRQEFFSLCQMVSKWLMHQALSPHGFHSENNCECKNVAERDFYSSINLHVWATIRSSWEIFVWGTFSPWHTVKILPGSLLMLSLNFKNTAITIKINVKGVTLYQELLFFVPKAEDNPQLLRKLLLILSCPGWKSRSLIYLLTNYW